MSCCLLLEAKVKFVTSSPIIEGLGSRIDLLTPLANDGSLKCHCRDFFLTAVKIA